jgi:hypothetical protein
LNSFHIYPLTYTTTGFKNLMCQQFTYPIPNSKKNYHLGDHKRKKCASAVPLSHPLSLVITKKQPTIPSRGDHPPITNSWVQPISPLHQPLLCAPLLPSRHLSASCLLVTTTHQIMPSPAVTARPEALRRCHQLPPHLIGPNLGSVQPLHHPNQGGLPVSTICPSPNAVSG